MGDVVGMPRTPGRPPIGQRVDVRLTPAELAAVDQIAERTGQSRAAVIRVAVAALARAEGLAVT